MRHRGAPGAPLPGVTLSIEEPDGDGVGEIVVTTPARFSGYVGETPAVGPIRTGDLGRLDDEGRLYVVDRRTDRIVRGGENVSPAEVEAVLRRAAVDRRCRRRGASRRGARPGAGGRDRRPARCRRPRRRRDPPGVPRVAGRVQGPGRDRPARRVAADVRRQAPPGRRAGARRRRSGRDPREARRRRDRLAGDRLGHRRRSSCSPARSRTPPSSTGSRPSSRDRATSTVHAIDRRGMGTSRLAHPAAARRRRARRRPRRLPRRPRDRPSGRGRRQLRRVVALEAAARHPDRVETLVAWEPPYGPLGDDASRARFATAGRGHRAGPRHRRSGRRGRDVPARRRRRRGLGPAPAQGPRLPRPRGRRAR